MWGQRFGSSALRVSAPGRGEGLAGEAGGEDGPAVRRLSKSKCKRPSGDAGEEVPLRVAGEVRRRDVEDGAVIHVSRRDGARVDEIA